MEFNEKLRADAHRRFLQWCEQNNTPSSNSAGKVLDVVARLMKDSDVEGIVSISKVCAICKAHFRLDPEQTHKLLLILVDKGLYRINTLYQNYVFIVDPFIHPL